ncbi:ABC transporter substrate-binding protein [Candidatus Albibeggiatoa sp. nov. NOAA]|uniref:ABC transporter substrate-binding protein n=1 Tax=Candidatus Albibeggiatoa sp. nov. NOAA TaxID=3162724 RepID=UPI003302ECCD|nr:ABC transporter substrate-binding protein [Thiotrichaceae bacterium]
MKHIALAWFIVFLTACTSSTPETEKKPLNISINLWPGYAYAFVAQEKGFFEKYGVNVNLQYQTDYEEALKLYEMGEAEGIFLASTDVFSLNVKGILTQIVYVADYSDSADVVIGLPEYQNLSDLKDKTVSFEGVGTFSQLLVFKLMERAGLQEGEFKTANILASQVVDALDSGQIQAGHTWEPQVTEALQKGYKILGKAGDVPGVVLDVLSFHTDTIEQRPEDVQAVVNALVEAYQFVQTHYDEAISIMAKAEGISEAEMSQGVQQLHLLPLEENIAAMQANGTMFQSGQITIDFFMQKGQFIIQPDLNAVINAQFIQAVP